MSKAFVKYLLSISILFLCGYSILSAHTYLENTNNAQEANQSVKENALCVALDQDQAYFINNSPYSSEKNFTVESSVFEIEEQEDEWITFKKFVENVQYLSTLFYALTLGFFSLYIKNRLYFCKQSTYFSFLQPLYLRFRVFRI